MLSSGNERSFFVGFLLRVSKKLVLGYTGWHLKEVDKNEKNYIVNNYCAHLIRWKILTTGKC